MKRKTRNRKGQKTLCVSCKRHSAFLGLVHDFLWVCKAFVHVFAWPCQALARAIHNGLRKHPAFRFKHAHAAICVSCGVALLGVSFGLEHLFHHTAWAVTIETARAAGVCPIWETIAGVLKLGAEFEG